MLQGNRLPYFGSINNGFFTLTYALHGSVSEIEVFKIFKTTLYEFA